MSGVGTWEGGWDGLASAVRVRLPLVQSARLQRSSSGDPLAHPALDSPACASRSCPFSDLQLQREQLSRNGLHGWMANRTLHPTMEPDLRGRTARDLQSRNKRLYDTYREELSDLGHLGLDHAWHIMAYRTSSYCKVVADREESSRIVGDLRSWEIVRS